MKAKGAKLLSTLLLASVLVASACSPPGQTSGPPLETLPATTSTLPATPRATTAAVEKPQYGGTLNLMHALTNIGILDPAATGQLAGPLVFLVNEQYVGEDWTKGTAGTGEITWSPNTGATPGNCTGLLAESWAMPAPGTIVFKVRRGVHWALDSNSEASRLMNGREATPDDWIASFNYFVQHPRSIFKAAPQLTGTATMEQTGPWEITLKTPVDPLAGWGWLAWGTAMYFLFPPEVIKKYGDMKDWRNVVGTGPFMLTDYVEASSATLKRNPGFWEKDPIGPGKGSRLPYLDGIRMLLIPDISTQLAALRTGKADLARAIVADDASSLVGTTPELRQRTFLPLYSTMVAMRIDKADLPYKDKRVRQALMMATDFDSLKNDFYGGDAELFSLPVTRESKNVYVPLEDMPESVRALYRHDPDKAKQMLAEAGYPDGFKARMIVYNGLGSVDLASVLKDMWAKAGIELELLPKEPAVYNTIGYTRAYDDMMLAHLAGITQYPGLLGLGWFRGPASFFYINDPIIEAAGREIEKHAIVNMPEADRLYREALPHFAEQAYYVPTTTSTAYVLWWPWLKNFYGEMPGRFAAYHWIDRDLKQELAGRR